MNTDNAQPAAREAASPQLNADRARRIAEERRLDGEDPRDVGRGREPRGILYAGAVGLRRPGGAPCVHGRGPVPVVLDDQDRHRHRSRAPARRRSPRPRRTHRHLPARLPAPPPGTVTPPRGSCSPTPPGWPTRCRSAGSDPRTSPRTRLCSTAIIAKHGTPEQARGRSGRVLQHRVPPGRRGHRGCHRPLRRGLRPRRRPRRHSAWTATGYAYDADAPRSVGYVRIHAAVVPAAPLGCCPSGIVGPRVEGHTALRPFLVNGAAYGGLVGTVTDAARLAAAHAASHVGRPPGPQRTTTSRRCAPSPRPGSGSTTASAGSASRPTPHRTPGVRRALRHRRRLLERHAHLPRPATRHGGDDQHHLHVGLRPPLHPTQGPVMDTDRDDLRHRAGPPRHPGDRPRRPPQQRRRRAAAHARSPTP